MQKRQWLEISRAGIRVRQYGQKAPGAKKATR
jgi:hypothetical protein